MAPSRAASTSGPSISPARSTAPASAAWPPSSRRRTTGPAPSRAKRAQGSGVWGEGGGGTRVEGGVSGDGACRERLVRFEAALELRTHLVRAHYEEPPSPSTSP